MDLVKLFMLILSLLIALTDAKSKSGSKSGFSGKSKSKTKTKTKSFSSGSYPKQQWTSGGIEPSHGHSSHNYGQVSGGYNYGQVSGGHNYGQVSGGYNYGEPPKSSKSSKTSAVGGAIVGAYVTHKVHKNGKKVLKPKKPKIVAVGPRPTKRPKPKANYIYLPIVERMEWNATSLTELNIRPGDSFSKVIVHHTSSPDCYDLAACISVLKDVEQRNMAIKKLDNIGYNFMIGGDGRIYDNLGWSMYSKITNRPSIEPKSLQVAFIGDFNFYPPNQRQLEAFEALITYADNKDILKKYRIHGHRDVSCTTCPGEILYGIVRSMRRYKPVLGTTTRCAGRQTNPATGGRIELDMSNSVLTPQAPAVGMNPVDSNDLSNAIAPIM